eukprot:Opistho-2@13608
MANIKQLRLVLWKNYLLKKRRPLASLIELLLPLALFVILLYVRHRKPPVHYIDAVDSPQCLPSMGMACLETYKGFGSRYLDVVINRRDVDEAHSFANGTAGDDDPDGGRQRRTDIASALLSRQILYAPSGGEVEAFIDSLKMEIASYFGAATIILLGQTFKGFPDEESLAEHATGNSDVLAGIVLNNVVDGKLPSVVDYSLRMRPYPFGTQRTDKLFPNYRRKAPYSGSVYLYGGFTLLQDFIDRAVIRFRTGQSLNLATFVEWTPYPEHTKDSFAAGIAYTFPLLMVLSWIYSVSMLVKGIVHEKELRLKEVMKMMGLKTGIYWAGWYIQGLVFMVTSSICITVIIKSGGLLIYSSGSVIFVFLLAFAMATISLSFLISVFFSRAKLAAACAGIVYFLSYLPYVIVMRETETMSSSQKGAACLLSTTALGVGAAYLSDFEQRGDGLHWNNVFETQPYDNFNFGRVIIMLFIDSFLYLILAWYIEGVFPGQFGVPRPWYFPFTKAYWSSSPATSSSQGLSNTNGTSVAQLAGVARKVKGAVLSLAQRNGKTRGKHAPLSGDDDEGGDRLLGTDEEVAADDGRDGTFAMTDESRGDASATSLANDVPSDDSVRGGGASDFEAEPRGLEAGIRLSHLGKVYDNGKVAVEDLSLNMYRGQITALLGHNGAGKTTTMSMLTGLFPPSSGDAFVNGASIREGMDSIRQSLGFVPQYNCLLESLTVMEHCQLFCGFKGVDSDRVDAECRQIIEDLHLSDKINANAQTLSGGMKRKLSVGLALVGGSKVIICDEASAGVDVSSRRAIWDLLIRHKEGRTILLSTHHMDEADFLGDRIAIIADGRLRCVGSSMFLKSRFGVGYHLTVVKKSGCNEDAVADAVARNVPGSRPSGNAGAELSFVLPREESHLFPQLLDSLDSARAELGISSYGMSVTTLEEVFLRVAETPAEGDGSSASANAPDKSVRDIRSVDMGGADNVADHPLASMKDVHVGKFGHYLLQFGALVVKRFNHAKRDKKAVLSQLLLPACFVAIAMAVATMYPPPTDQPALAMVPTMFASALPAKYAPTQVLVSATDNTTTVYPMLAQIIEALPRIDPTEQYVNVPYHASANSSLRENLSPLEREWLENEHALTMRSYGGYVFGHDPTGLAGDRPAVVIVYQGVAYHSLPVYLTLLNNAALQVMSGGLHPEWGIVSRNYPLPKTAMQKADEYRRQGTDLVVGIFLIIALSFVPASFVLYLVQERSVNAKHMQLASGASQTVYWLATFMWDLFTYLFPLLVSILVIVAFQDAAYTGENLKAVFLLMLAYCWSMTPLMYILSFLFNVPPTAYVVLICVNLFTGLTSTIATYVLEIFKKSDPDLQSLNDLLMAVFPLLPNYCLGRGLMDIAVNEYVSEYYGIAGIQRKSDPLAWGITGKNLTFMFIEGWVFFAITLVVEYRFFGASRFLGKHIMRFAPSFKRWWNALRCCCGRHVDGHVRLESDVEGGVLGVGLRELGSEASGTNDEDSDVREERRRVEGGEGASDILRVEGLRKDFSNVLGTNAMGRPAVDNVWFGVPRGECFGLLGVNGAGKTTTFRMLTGDCDPSSGDAYLDNLSITRELSKVRERIGYCPQFDALNDLLTGRELLWMYARLRGLKELAIPRVVSWCIDRLHLGAWADRPCGTYSGGNKRKLSVAVALVGNPPVIFCDEPSTGIDVVSRRFLWNTIASMRGAGRSIILTSHSMEECEALCTRMAIMVQGRFRCLGSAQHLKDKFGSGYTLILRVSHDREDAVPALRRHIESVFDGAIMKECHQTLLQYELPAAGDPNAIRGVNVDGQTEPSPRLSLAKVFSTMESAKDEYGIEDYSLSQTTLEQVFIGFAREQPSEED